MSILYLLVPAAAIASQYVQQGIPAQVAVKAASEALTRKIESPDDPRVAAAYTSRSGIPMSLISVTAVRALEAKGWKSTGSVQFGYGVMIPPTTMTAQLTAGVPDNPKTREYRNAEILKQHVEVRARAEPGTSFAVEVRARAEPGTSFAMVMSPYVSADVLSESELPKASSGFRWVKSIMATSHGAFARWSYQPGTS